MTTTKGGILDCGCQWQREGTIDVIVAARNGCRLHDPYWEPPPIPQRSPLQLWWATWGVWVIVAVCVIAVFMLAAGVGATLAWLGTVVILAFGVLFCWWTVETLRGR